MDTGLYGYSPEWIAATLDAPLNLTKRWKRAGRVPAKYQQWLEFTKHRDIGALSPDWQGWRLQDGTLWTPEGEAVSQGRIRAIPYYDALILDLKQKVSEPQQWALL